MNLTEVNKRLKINTNKILLKFNHSLFKDLFLNGVDYDEISAKFRYIITNNKITKDDVNKFALKLNEYENYNDLSIREKIMLEWLIINEDNEQAVLLKNKTI